jgi:6-phosphogluconate dehydrogenase (decarboxylating)
MTKIELSEFKDKLNEAKYYCNLVSQGDVVYDVVRCLNNLIDAVELLGDAVENHYHSKEEDEDFED